MNEMKETSPPVLDFSCRVAPLIKRGVVVTLSRLKDMNLVAEAVELVVTIKKPDWQQPVQAWHVLTTEFITVNISTGIHTQLQAKVCGVAINVRVDVETSLQVVHAERGSRNRNMKSVAGFELVLPVEVLWVEHLDSKVNVCRHGAWLDVRVERELHITVHQVERAARIDSRIRSGRANTHTTYKLDLSLQIRASAVNYGYCAVLNTHHLYEVQL